VVNPVGTWAASGWGEGVSWDDALEQAFARLYETGGLPSTGARVTGETASGSLLVSPPPVTGRVADETPPHASVFGSISSPDRAPSGPGLVIVFASSKFRNDFPRIVQRIRLEMPGRHVIGSSAWSVISGGRELEERDAIALMAVTLPGANLHAIAVSPEVVERTTHLPLADDERAARWHRALGVLPDTVNAWILFTDPFTVDANVLVDQWNSAYPGVPVIGGVASTAPDLRATELFLDGQVLRDGAVAIAIGGAWTLDTVVSQGCEPIGRPWTITGVEGDHMIRTIGRRPAIEVLAETVRALPADQMGRARGNLFAGIAVDERRSNLGRGDYLVRNLVGAEEGSGAILISGTPVIGQTIQFQVRDSGAAVEDLRTLLHDAVRRWGKSIPAAALVCSCNGRGIGLFGKDDPDHDAVAVQNVAPGMPVAGFACFGEIGPVGGRTFVHSHTASIGFFMPVSSEPVPGI